MLTRRNLLKSTAATGVTLAASGLAAPAIAQGARIRVGYVTPQSGPLAAFAEADQYIQSVKQNMRSLVRPALYDEIDKQELAHPVICYGAC